MLKPVLDSSELLNQKSAHIEQVERKISFYGLLITVHDRNIREDVGVALEIAQIQLDALKNFNKESPSVRSYQVLSDSIATKVDDLKNDYLINFRSLIKEREFVFEGKECIPLTGEKRGQLIQQFQGKLEESIKKFSSELAIDPSTDLETLINRCEEKYNMRMQTFNTIFEEKQKLSEESQILGMTDLRALCEEMAQIRNNTEVRTFHEYCAIGSLNQVKTMVERHPIWKRTNVNTPDSKQFSPLDYASYGNKSTVVDYLLSKKASTHQKGPDGYRPLHWASMQGAYHCAKALAEAKADVNAQGEFHRTPLHMAVFNRRLETTRLLLQHKANPNAQTSPDNGLQTSLHIAVNNKDAEIVNLILECGLGIDTSIKDQAGFTPLYYAVQIGSKRIIELLTGHKTCPIIKNDDDPNGLKALMELSEKLDRPEDPRGEIIAYLRRL
ncbi:MAG: ankyrin repeat domain-containing protein [Chlamydiia bacterium]|nr:ankyrin repeat domain-containing protein [Chlamydiia bacterium]